MNVCREGSVFVDKNFHKLKYKKLSESATALTRAASGSIGYDLLNHVCWYRQILLCSLHQLSNLG